MSGRQLFGLGWLIAPGIAAFNVVLTDHHRGWWAFALFGVFIAVGFVLLDERPRR